MGGRSMFQQFLADAKWRNISEFPAYIEEYGGFSYDAERRHYVHDSSGLSIRIEPEAAQLQIEATSLVDRAYARALLPDSVPLKQPDPDRHVFLYQADDAYQRLLRHMLDQEVERGELRKTWSSGVYHPVGETRKRQTAEIHAHSHDARGWGRREFPVAEGQIAVLIQATPIDPALANHIDHITTTLPLEKHIHYTPTWDEFFSDDTNVDEWLEETNL